METKKPASRRAFFTTHSLKTLFYFFNNSFESFWVVQSQVG